MSLNRPTSTTIPGTVSTKTGKELYFPHLTWASFFYAATCKDPPFFFLKAQATSPCGGMHRCARATRDQYPYEEAEIESLPAGEKKNTLPDINDEGIHAVLSGLVPIHLRHRCRSNWT